MSGAPGLGARGGDAEAGPATSPARRMRETAANPNTRAPLRGEGLMSGNLRRVVGAASGVSANGRAPPANGRAPPANGRAPPANGRAATTSLGCGPPTNRCASGAGASPARTRTLPARPRRMTLRAPTAATCGKTSRPNLPGRERTLVARGQGMRFPRTALRTARPRCAARWASRFALPLAHGGRARVHVCPRLQ